MALFVISNALLVPFLSAGSTPGTFFACLLFSLSMGIGTATSLRLLLRTAAPSETASIVSAVNLGAYLCSTVMNTGAGALTELLPFPAIFMVFTVFAALTTLYVVIFLRMRQSAAEPSAAC